MIGWHHWLNGHGFGWTPGIGDGQGGLACCGSWGHKESDTPEWLTETRPHCLKVPALAPDVTMPRHHWIDGKHVALVLRTPPPACRTDITDEALCPTSPHKHSLHCTLGRNCQNTWGALGVLPLPLWLRDSLPFPFEKNYFQIRFDNYLLIIDFIEFFIE